MKRLLLTVYPLIVIAVSAGALLGLAYRLLEKPLAQAELREETRAVQKALSAKGEIRRIEFTNDGVSSPYYLSLSSSGETQGYVFRTEKTGFGGPVDVLSGITNGAVDRVVVLSMAQETPGLGTKAMEPSWTGRFSGRTSGAIPRSIADFSRLGLDAVSGATYSSKAVSTAVYEAFRLYRKLVPLMTLTPQVTNIYGELRTNFVTNWTTELDASSGASEGGE
jgi:electron transport complex protein RnfG